MPILFILWLIFILVIATTGNPGFFGMLFILLSTWGVIAAAVMVIKDRRSMRDTFRKLDEEFPNEPNEINPYD